MSHGVVKKGGLGFYGCTEFDPDPDSDPDFDKFPAKKFSLDFKS
jgi:hypothetical protein